MVFHRVRLSTVSTLMAIPDSFRSPVREFLEKSVAATKKSIFLIVCVRDSLWNIELKSIFLKQISHGIIPGCIIFMSMSQEQCSSLDMMQVRCSQFLVMNIPLICIYMVFHHVNLYPVPTILAI